METKQKRTKVKVILSIILPVLLITGIFTVSGHAKKPPSPPGLFKTVEVTGDIVGTGNPAGMRVTFSATFFPEQDEHVANPDGPLEVSGPRNNKRLRYYYCDLPADQHPGLDCCDPEIYESHDPLHYKALTIYGGAVEGKGRDTKIFFPAGSRWVISSKEIMGPILEDTLNEAVIYEQVD